MTTKRFKYELPKAEDIAPTALAVSAVGLHVDQTPAHALWAAVEAAAGARIPVVPPAVSLAAARDDAALFRAATLRGVFRHWAPDGQRRQEFVEGYPVPAYFVLPSIAEGNVKQSELVGKYVAMVRRSLQDGAGMAFHDISPRSSLLASTASKSTWPDLFTYFDKAADLAALLLFAEDGPATRSTFGGWPLRPDETPERTFARERRANGDLAEAFAGLMLTRSASAQRLRELAEHVIDASQTVSFGDGRQGRTAHGFAYWSNRFVDPYYVQKTRFPFQPTEYVPDPWSKAQCAQFDAMPVLSWVYRPRVADYRDADGTALTAARCAEQLRAALDAAIGGPLEGKAPARVFYDVGRGDASGPRRMTLTTALHAVLPDFDLLDVKKGYDLSRRLGDAGAATTVAGVGMASIAAWETGGTALVIHARRDDGAIVLAVRPSSEAHRRSYRKRPYDAA
jgi:hypothetical protein